MSRFQFHLQTLLDYRIRREDALKRRLAEIESALLREQQALEELEQARRTAVSYYNQLALEVVDVEEERLFRSFYARLCSQIEDKRKVISDLNEELNAQLERVVEAMRERKTVQSLRDKQFEQFKLGELKREQAFLDDIATTQFVASQVAGENPI